jgi:hypothetical protein
VTREMPAELPISKLRYFSVPGALKRIPEPAPERVPDLVVQQRVDGQGGALQQPRLEVGRHPGLAGEHCLEPERGSVPGHRLTEAEPLGVRRLHRLANGHGDRRRRLGQLHRLLRPAVWRLRVARAGWRRSVLAWLPPVGAVPVGLRVRHAVGSRDLALRSEAALRIERSEGALLTAGSRR